ncbi:MAG TPA: DUF5659 domain-containing protein [Candidatus Moranbacteria bacterium]|nr:DUF5659 domain-containing protein [Candidatus Moranbacteria bacterium]HRY27539.1 DUF5659 domain-containing protein [Candidatus Moranbacteria bacterium]HSA07768.1 DUF5659 domain-containing protein [Candidatus Moranbacteria bacterium]
MTKNQLSGISEKQGRISSDNYQDFMTTYDLGCSSAIISAGFELVSLDKSNPKKVQFIFHRELGIEKVVDDYFADKLEVKARTFFDNVKMLKNRIYSE